MSSLRHLKIVVFGLTAMAALILLDRHGPVVTSAIAQTQAAQDENAAEDDGISWPREITNNMGTIVIYQPQLDELEGPKLSGRAAFSLRKSEKDEPAFGALWFNARVDANMEERLAYIDNVSISRIALPDTSDDDKKKLASAIEGASAKGATTISVDRLAVALQEAKTALEDSDDLNNEPPKIIISNAPAVLLFIDGKPKLSAIEGSKILAMENTPFPIVLDPASKSYYLNGGTIWYKASAIEGPWKHTEKVPGNISGLIDLTDEQKKDLVKLVGSDKDERIPEIIYTDVPTELIVIDGKASFSPLVGADLLYVENSETALFMDPGTQKYYVLLSGRWYVNSKLENQGWTYVTSGELPPAFAEIPEDSDRGNVLSQIAGTEQAEEAIAEASMPQVTAIDRKQASVEVAYDGDPQFEPIEGTEILYAVNTSSTVLKIKDLYYVVDQGVWFVSDNATGPWAVADEVPEDVEDIPPSNPTYNVKYVKVYESTPDYVYVGYTPGYLGSYIYGGTIVYGTGYYYRPWWNTYYYPRPLTWCLGAYFRPWLGWGYAVGWGRFHFHAGFGPAYRWHRRRGHGWYGPGGFHTRRYDNYRRKHHRASHNRHRNNLYNRASNRNRNHFKQNRPNRDALRRDFAGKKSRANNVFTDRKGNIYRKNKDNWQRHDGKKWRDTKLDGAKRPGVGEGRPGTKDKLQRPATKDKLNKAKKPAKKAKKQTRKPKKSARKANKPAKKAKRPAKKQKKAKAQKRKKSSSQRRRKSSNSLQRHSRARSRGNQRTRSHSTRRRSGGGGRSGGRRGGGRRR
ncbi:MAG: hypothetical protein ACR2OL_04200 [Anderseniella sp.]